jgi:putative acetyltransferase
VDLRIIDVDPLGDVALSLLREAAVEVRALYADVLPPDRPWPVNARPGPRDVYVVAYRGQHPVASGALRELDSVSAEVRRMFVLREHRRNRISHAVLTHLVAEARRLGYERIRLETGNKQVAAIALYEGFGFRRIAPFRPFDDDPTSVCFELAIVHV